MTKTPVRLVDLFRYFKGLPHQLAAIDELESAMPSSLLNRENGWFQTWSQAGKQHDRSDALALIREFEGCHLTAYPDPLSGGEPWTIGWGTTRYADGRKVAQGDTIAQSEADQLLAEEIERIAAKLSAIPHWADMEPAQQGALLSFAYNLGSGFYGSEGFETISRCLREKDWPGVPAALLLYRNPGTNVEAGLRRRREAEGRAWASALAAQPMQQQTAEIRLKVPYESQNNNASGTGYRECFSSSAAMVARFYGKVANDDAYNKIRAKFGDTTDSMAQVKALNSLGLSAQFRTNGTVALLESELKAGRPVMVGWLHHGPASRPTGGGHWSVAIGCTPTAFIHNDPNGEADLAGGGYVSQAGGAGVAYSRQNWLRRWLPDGPTSGWCITISET